jgi:hypothetical protein
MLARLQVLNSPDLLALAHGEAIEKLDLGHCYTTRSKPTKKRNRCSIPSRRPGRFFLRKRNSAPGYDSPTASIRQRPSYARFKEWDVRTPHGTMHRILGRGTDGSMQLLASEYDGGGDIIATSTCYLRHDGWSDCTTNDGVHYQLKPSTISYLYGDIPCPSATLCNR